MLPVPVFEAWWTSSHRKLGMGHRAARARQESSRCGETKLTRFPTFAFHVPPFLSLMLPPLPLPFFWLALCQAHLRATREGGRVTRNNFMTPLKGLRQVGKVTSLESLQLAFKLIKKIQHLQGIHHFRTCFWGTVPCTRTVVPAPTYVMFVKIKLHSRPPQPCQPKS